jgi:hypothetical protein
MAKHRYDKVYAVLKAIERYDEPGKYRIEAGQLLPKLLRHPVWVFETADGEIIRAANPGRSGHTPRRLRQKWHRLHRELMAEYSSHGKKYRDAVECLNSQYLVGEQYKLYQRPQDNGRWTYRHMGQ